MNIQCRRWNDWEKRRANCTTLNHKLNSERQREKNWWKWLKKKKEMAVQMTFIDRRWPMEKFYHVCCASDDDDDHHPLVWLSKWISDLPWRQWRRQRRQQRNHIQTIRDTFTQLIWNKYSLGFHSPEALYHMCMSQKNTHTNNNNNRVQWKPIYLRIYMSYLARIFGKRFHANEWQRHRAEKTHTYEISQSEVNEY